MVQFVTTIRLDSETREALDKARGFEPLSHFVRRKLRESLGLEDVR
jgi:hypothetical protein